MSEAFLAIFIAALAGALMAVQGTLNSCLSKTSGLMGATFAVHIIGLLIILPLLFGLKIGYKDFKHILQAPWYCYLGGIISVAIIYMVAASISRNGATSATTAIIAAQVLTAAFLDQFALFGLDHSDFTLLKGLGIVFLAVGTWLLLKTS